MKKIKLAQMIYLLEDLENYIVVHKDTRKVLFHRVLYNMEDVNIFLKTFGAKEVQCFYLDGDVLEVYI